MYRYFNGFETVRYNTSDLDIYCYQYICSYYFFSGGGTLLQSKTMFNFSNDLRGTMMQISKCQNRCVRSCWSVPVSKSLPRGLPNQTALVSVTLKNACVDVSTGLLCRRASTYSPVPQFASLTATVLVAMLSILTQ